METSKNIQDKPDFSTLTGIMTRFAQVPYGQFQKELDEWFADGLGQQSIKYTEFDAMGKENLPSLLSDLVTSIYERAERQCEGQGGGHGHG
ncbi:hypothetical protein KXQ82_04415 [Mucilaginibacter sp. HMF5004]|uniref:hypothetical protein n=1 Tax=Mucilaginibacter rivuli TaxID=2857527 RepID=UPI001C5FA406|nr:hypothetical protein [Mucilaginibacter rivuli]MBW4888941.1 hypothetical protein [Mucilaginibacter rivuli]